MTVTTAVAPRPATVVRLMAGRATFRLGSQLMPVALLVVWGDAVFDGYASAVGLFLWLVFVPTAVEKAALKVLPRTRLLTARLARLTLLGASAPVAVLVVALAVALAAAATGATVTLYLAAASWSAATGLLMTVSGLHRLHGRPELDTRAFVAAAAAVLVATAATWLAGWAPWAHLLALLVGLLAIIGVTVSALPPAWLPRPSAVRNGGRPLLRPFWRSVWLLGLPELLDVAAVSLVFLVLAVSGRTADSGPLYLALVLSAAVGSLLTYALKLYQPATSVRLRGAAGAGGRARAAHLLLLAQRVGLGFAVVLAGCLAVPATRSALLATSGAWQFVTLAALVAVEIVVATLVLYAAFLLENTNSRVLTVTASAAVVGLVADVALAVALVPWLGAVGGFAALVLGPAVKAFVLRRMLLGHLPTSSSRS